MSSAVRVRALRSLQSSLRHTGARATPRVSAPARTQLAVGRRYASGESGHGHAEPGSDLPWLAGAIAVTIPSCWFLWPSTSHADSGHHGGHDEHAEEHEEKEEEAPEEEAPQEGQEKQAEEVQSEQKEESEPQPETDTTQKVEESKDSEETGKASGSGGEGQSTGSDANKLSSKHEESEQKEVPEAHGDTDNGAAFKGKVKEDSDAKTEENRKREPDSKGAYKKRIDSGLGKDLGEGPEFDEPEGDSPRTESSATSKPPQKGEHGEVTGKQFGISNTPTRHSTKIEESGDKSTKGEGTPETAKAMGTVSVDRPQK
ncbi:hypothetical protein LTR36_002110 [Oleoguttula mirabilis]|uniref:Uncharacterized protein n=1 Tax=Oleoguttula mirabilis TaxID=1507867 RepID=A0AAV9JM59_9PEZI|nr:hypothetical protein LTR36_002110 [Oleoguttula mirabilis]